MRPVHLPHRLLGAALCATLAVGSTGCAPAPSEQELLTGEAAARLTASEEGAGADDAVVAATDTELASFADEEAEGAQAVPAEAGEVCDFSARREQVLREYDTDGSGRLERDELRALKEDLGLVRPRFARLGWRLRHWAFGHVRWVFDEDGDHQLSTEERTALVDALEARCNRIRANVLARYDADGDGRLSETERAAARQDRRERLEAKYQELLARYDVDGSGQLERTERAQLREDVLARVRARRQELVAQYDTNGDGRLSTEEALPLRQALQRRIAEGPDAQP